MSDDYDDFEIEDDLSDIPDSGDPPPARYLFRIAKMEMKGRKNDQSQKYINIQFKIEDVLDPKLESFIGRSVFDIFNLSSQSLWKIKGVVNACRGEDAAKGKRIPNMTDELVVADTFEDSYEGRVNLRTKGYKNADDWSGIVMDLAAGPSRLLPGEEPDAPAAKAAPPATAPSAASPAPAPAGEVEI